MSGIAPVEFDLTSYPRSYASIERMRLRRYASLPVDEQERVFHALERFCIARAERISPRQTFDGYPFLGAGWEWSVFRKDQDTVIKVPSGIFPETNDPEYLENVEHIYRLLGEYYPEEMLAKTAFRRVDGLNVQEQHYIAGAESIVIPYNTADTWLLGKLVTFFEATASVIEDMRWMPDLWLTEMAEGFRLRSVLIDRDRDQFAIIDFSQYLDPCRMYPALRDACCASFSERISILLAWSKSRLRDVSASS